MIVKYIQMGNHILFIMEKKMANAECDGVGALIQLNYVIIDVHDSE